MAPASSLFYSLERCVIPVRTFLSAIRLKIPPTPSPVKHRQILLLPQRQLMVPRPSLSCDTRIRFHSPVIAGANEHEIVQSVQELAPTHTPVPAVMRHQVILHATVSTMLIPSPKECEGFFWDSHNVSLYLGLGPDGFDLAAKPSQELSRTGVRLSSAPQK